MLFWSLKFPNFHQICELSEILFSNIFQCIFAVVKIVLLKGNSEDSENFTPVNNTQYTVKEIAIEYKFIQTSCLFSYNVPQSIK